MPVESGHEESSADDDHPSKFFINFGPFEANIDNTKTSIEAVLRVPLFTKEEMYEA